MIILIAGPSHTGKTALAQRLLEKYHYPYLSIDHLKMGLIRSGQTDLTPMDDDKLTDYLWPIVREMIKTAIENEQNLIVEGCYIPYNWKESFAPMYLEKIRYRCLVMSEGYIRSHFADILDYANTVIASPAAETQGLALTAVVDIAAASLLTVINSGAGETGYENSTLTVVKLA